MSWLLDTDEGTYAIIFSIFGLSLAAGFTVSFVRRIRSIVTAGLGLAVMSILVRPSRQAGLDHATRARG